MEDKDISAPFVKIVTSVLAAIAGLKWSELAAFLAASYTFLLIAEWFWKKLWRPMGERRGWIAKKRMRRVAYYETDNAPL